MTRREPLPTAAKFIDASYREYRAGKKNHRHYVSTVFRRLFKTPLPDDEWSAMACRKIYARLRADEAGGVMNLQPLSFRKEALKARGRIPWTLDDIAHMRMAEMSYSNLVEPQSTVQHYSEEETSMATKIDVSTEDFGGYSVDKDDAENWAEYAGHLGISWAGFEAILKAFKVKSTRAIKAAWTDGWEEKDPKIVSDPIPYGMQKLLRLSLKGGKQAHFEKLLQLPKNVKLNPEASKAQKEKAAATPKFDKDTRAKKKEHKPVDFSKKAQAAKAKVKPKAKAKSKSK